MNPGRSACVLQERVVLPLMASDESSRVAKGVVSQSRGSERLANGWSMRL